MKETVQGMLATTGTGLGDVAPHGLIRVLDEIFNYDDTISESEKRWNKYQDISSQIIDIANRYQLNDDSMVLNEGEREYRAYSVRRFPDRWSLGMMDRLIGDSYRDLLNISCPFIVQYGAHIVDSKILKNGILAKASKLEAQASSILGNWIPSLVRESQELGYVRARLDNGEDRLVKTHYQVILMDKPERMRQSEQSLYSLYISNRWRLGIDKYIVLPSLLSVLPMSWGDGMQKDMSYFKRMRTTISEEPISLLPIRGEFKGTRTPGMLLTGRRGQIIWWSPFDGRSNFNVCVVGTTGSGKSFFMQELCQQILSLAGKVYVLDKGRSFEKLALISKGQFLDFNRKAKICINPFTTIDATDEDAIEDSLSILAPIISQMAGLKEGTTDKEDNIISEGLRVIWERKKNDAMIDDLVNWLETEKDHTDAKNLATKLYRYRRDGSYGMYFNGKANIDLDDNFVVTELGDLQYKEGLLLVIVKMVLLMISNKIVLVGDRSIKKAIVFDEAWQLLQGHAGAKFVDELVRTVRKHGGAVVCGTQGIDDFFKNEGSEAAYNFAEHLVIFQQDQDTLKRLVDKGRISIVPGEDTILTTLKTEPGKYAEMMIKSRVYRFAARLMVDNFSKILYSTKDTEYQAVKDLIDRGMEVKDAILQVTKEVYGHE